MKPGIYEEMSMNEYQAVDAISRSDIVRLLRSPAHYQYHKGQGDVDKPSYRFGRAFHSSQLEGIPPTVNLYDGRSKAGKEFQEKNPDAIKPGEDEVITAMNKSLADFEWGNEIEQSFFWKQDGILCKCRPDAIVKGYVVDLKTTRRSAERFCWDISDYRYDIQAAWYLRGVQQHTPVCGFQFLSIEKEPPYGWMLYEIDNLNQAEESIAYAMELYRKCKKADTWPGYDKQVRRV